jgi:hypothetical protein
LLVLPEAYERVPEDNQSLNNYLYTCVVQQLKDQNLQEDLCKIVAYKLVGDDAAIDTYDDLPIIRFPRSKLKEIGINTKFFEEVKNYILSRKEIVVSGHSSSADTVMGALQRCSGSDWLARKDSTYEYWTLFNYFTGYKVRLRIGDDSELPILAAKVPELLDVKITNRCDSNCAYCYQSSTSDGYVADYNDILHVVEVAAAKNVFEIAYGGGEPTTYNGFFNLVEDTYEAGVIPNFTTHSLEWLRNPFYVDQVNKYCGKVAVTINSSYEADNLISITEASNIDQSKITAQILLGAVDNYQLDDIASIFGTRYSKIGVTFLGFVNKGRATTYTPTSIIRLDTLRAVAKSVCWDFSSFGISAALASQWAEELTATEGVSTVFYKAHDEGNFSMYFDVVEHLYAASSFSDKVFSYKQQSPDIGFAAFAEGSLR